MGRKFPASLQVWLKCNQITVVRCVCVVKDNIHKGDFIVVLSRDFICCLLHPSFLICKVKGLDNIILKVFFSASFSGNIYILKKKKKCVLATQPHSHPYTSLLSQ